MDVYETHLMKNPQLPFIFHPNVRRAPEDTYCESSNWHENIEVLYGVSGHGTVLYDGVRIPMSEGDFVVINANSLHGVCTNDGAFHYLCLIIDRSFCLANFVDTNKLRFTTSFRDETLGAQLEVLLREYEAGYRSDYSVQTVRAVTLSILAHLCRHYSERSDGRDADTRSVACIRRAIGYIRACPEGELTLDCVSAQVGLSKYHFAREFRRITAYTFVTYVNTVRCEKAKRLLSESRMTIGEIGRVCGFLSPSYFTRIFRQHTGYLPGAYREKHLSEAGVGRK